MQSIKVLLVHGGNYTISFTDNNLVVTPAPLTVTASNNIMTYGGTIPTITPSYSSMQNSDTAPSTPATCSTMAIGTSAVGSYSSNCSDPDPFLTTPFLIFPLHSVTAAF